MPVSTTARAPGADRQRPPSETSTSTAGRQWFSGAPWLQMQSVRRADARAGEHLHMPVAPGDVDGPGAHRLALDGLMHPQRATGIEPFGKEPGKQLRHVLHDQDRQRKVAGSAGSRRSRAAGPPVETPMASATGSDGIGCALGNGAIGAVQRAARKARNNRLRLAGEGLNFGDQILGQSP